MTSDPAQPIPAEMYHGLGGTTWTSTAGGVLIDRRGSLVLVPWADITAVEVKHLDLLARGHIRLEVRGVRSQTPAPGDPFAVVTGGMPIRFGPVNAALDRFAGELRERLVPAVGRGSGVTDAGSAPYDSSAVIGLPTDGPVPPEAVAGPDPEPACDVAPTALDRPERGRSGGAVVDTPDRATTSGTRARGDASATIPWPVRRSGRAARPSPDSRATGTPTAYRPPGDLWPSTEVVGESHYGRALQRVLGPLHLGGERELEVEATIAREPTNTYDPNAVAVRVHGELVGHLSREDAVDCRPSSCGSRPLARC